MESLMICTPHSVLYGW